MALPADYISGTITLTNGSPDFTGTGTGWQAADFREGDILLGVEDHAGQVYVIATITGNAAGTLTQAWAGTSGTYTYRMRYEWDSSRVSAQARAMVELLGNGNLEAFASLTGPGVPVFNGPHAMTIRPETDFINGVAYDVQVDTLADRAAYNGQATGFAVLVSNVGDGRSALFTKVTNASGDWTDPAYITGPSVTLAVSEVDSVPFGTPPDVTLTPVAGGYTLAFDIPLGMIIEPGTTTTLPPTQPAEVTFVPITGGYRLDIALPRGPAGDITGVTPFWQTIITGDVGLIPSADPQRNYITAQAPVGQGWIDNVLAIQNNSDPRVGDGAAGNAAINFLDSAGTERAAVGYSRNSAIDPNGYYPETLYLEIGNAFTTDNQATKLAVISTHLKGSTAFPLGGAGDHIGWKNLEVDSVTGHIQFRKGPTNGDVKIGSRGDVMRETFGLAEVEAVMGEYYWTDMFGIAVNSKGDGSQVNTSKPTWLMYMGGGSGRDYFAVRRSNPGSSILNYTDPDFLRVTSNGRVWVNQSATGAGIDGMVSAIATDAVPAFTGRRTSVGSVGLFHNQTNTGDCTFVEFGTETAYTFRGTISYNRSAGLTAYNTTSDHRAKEVHGPVENPIERLMLLNPVRGKMHDATDEMDFFVAHELAEVVPSAVTGEKDAVNEDGTPQFQQVDKSAIIPLLTAALQDAVDEIRSIRQELDALKEKMNLE